MTQEYATVADMAERWNLTKRQVQKFCNAGMIPGAIRFGIVWAIPEDAEKPTRTGKSKPGRKPKSANGEESSRNGESEH
jgi:hypothetical protein